MSAAVSAQMVRQLRDATGAGMMECKKALTECEGDFDRAVDFLRVKSGVKADKVATRAASEGRVVFAAGSGSAVLTEINCETDFVARDEAFTEFCKKAAQSFLSEDPAQVDGGEMSIPEECEAGRRELVMRVGENVSFGQTRALSAQGEVAHYVHTGGKIAAMLDYSGGNEETARDICMHIAAMRPDYLQMADIPESEMQKQREIFAAQAAETGKPPQVAEKIAEGKLQKHFAERVLQMQQFVKDGDKTVGAFADSAGIKLLGFRRLSVGGA